MTNQRVNFDIDIDVANRDLLLEHFKHVNASIISEDGHIKKHNSGVYFHDIPKNSKKQSTIDYKNAESRGYFKFDILNVSIYNDIKTEEEMSSLMVEPNWDNLQNEDFFKKVIHISNHYDVYKKLLEPLDSIPRMAMFLAIIRPGKKHLQNQTWKDIAKTVWDQPTDGSYAFKKSHSVAYSHLVALHMNLLEKQSNLSSKFS